LVFPAGFCYITLSHLPLFTALDPTTLRKFWGIKLGNLTINMQRAGVAAQDSALPSSTFSAAATENSEAISLIKNKSAKPKVYTLALTLLTLLGVAAVWNGNQIYGPEMYATNGMVPAAEAFSTAQNYAVFDLNLNIRRMKDETIARLPKTPDVIILGASHWQEAHADLLPQYSFYNAHVHRDYWEDLLGVTEMLVSHNRLPKKMIISIRDMQFTPIAARKDFLWEPGIPYYRAMADRLGLEKESYWSSLPYNRIKGLFSLSILFDNFTRWYNAKERPHASSQRHFETLDTLLPDGSIVWSNKHIHLFTQERARKEAIALADSRVNTPPKIDPEGVVAFEKLLDYLKAKGVSVYLINPPFNPIYYDRMQGTPYAEGLAKVEALMQRLATDHRLPLLGSFDPHKVGCESSMYIDAEHSNALCLKKLLDQFALADGQRAGN
jgi:hypothetical protein